VLAEPRRQQILHGANVARRAAGRRRHYPPDAPPARRRRRPDRRRGVGTAYYVSRHHYGGNVKGTSTEFEPAQTAVPPQPHESSIVSPVFGGVPQHLHVGVGKLRPPFRLVWVSGGTSLVEFPPAVAFHYLYYATLAGNLVAVSTRNGLRLWTVHVGRCEASSPAVDRLGRGSVYESFLNRHPCGRNAAKRGDGEILTVAAGPSHRLRWRKHLGATETSPLIVHNRIYVGDARGTCTASRPSTARPSGRSTPEEP
jgi:hypothetical protein